MAYEWLERGGDLMTSVAIYFHLNSRQPVQAQRIVNSFNRLDHGVSGLAGHFGREIVALLN